MVLVSFFGCQNKLHSFSNKRNTTTSHALLNDSTLLLAGVSSDSLFGKIESKPIMLGLFEIRDAASDAEKYLKALTGPHGEEVTFQRLKACCPFRTKNFRLNYPMMPTEFNGRYGLLERYQITYYDGRKTNSTILYINLYDESKELYAPQGFLYKNEREH